MNRTPCRDGARHRALALVVACLGLASAPPASADATRWAYTLPRDATTSAGVYDGEGVLLRTLWSGEARSAGAHDETWDGRDDHGAPVPAGTIEIRLLHHRIAYVWEGVVGNSSDTFDGALAHKAYLPPIGIAVNGNEVIYASGYNERQPGLHVFRTPAPQHATRPFASTDPYAAHAMIAADATRLYWADVGGLSATSFIGAHDLASRRRVPFARGTAVCLARQAVVGPCHEPQQYDGVIDVEADAAQAPTGLAVQAKGRVLAVGHGASGRIRLFDKSSGEPLGELRLPMRAGALNQIAMTPRGDLWVATGQALERWSDLLGKPRVTARVAGLELALAVAADPKDEGVWVADGMKSAQLKRYGGSGNLLATIGQRGGYAGDPAASADKFCFTAREGDERTAVATESDGSVWIVDTCNDRMLRLRAGTDGRYASDLAIAYLPAFYTSAVDHGRPRRVFANFLEFEVDDAAPLRPGTSWRLVRNWLGSLPAGTVRQRAANFGFDGFLGVETLASGRTIAIVAGEAGRQSLVELTASGPARLLKTLPAAHPPATGTVLYENGDIGHALVGTSTQAVLRRPLIGFDAAGDPVWAAMPAELARVPRTPGSPFDRGAFSGMPPRFPVTGSSRVVFFDPSVAGNEGFHLGAAAMAGTRWLWQASPSGALDGKGSFQTRAVDGSIQYGGNAVWANGRHIVYGYHGEFYRDLVTHRVGQANQFMHFDESGLFLGQFGEPSTRDPQPGQPGLSGNAFSPSLVRSGGRLYLYHNDESSHGGVHRWRIDGADDIGELRGSGATGSAIALH